MYENRGQSNVSNEDTERPCASKVSRTVEGLSSGLVHQGYRAHIITSFKHISSLIPRSPSNTSSRLLPPQIHNRHIHPLNHNHMSRSSITIRIQPSLTNAHLIMRMKQSRLPTLPHNVRTRRIRKPIHTPHSLAVVILIPPGANDGNGFSEINLVPDMRMQIPATHEAGLSGVCMDPAQHHQRTSSTIR